MNLPTGNHSPNPRRRNEHETNIFNEADKLAERIWIRMTPTNDAEKALELLAKEIFDYRDSPSTPKTIQKAIETIRTAIAKSAKGDDVIRELETMINYYGDDDPEGEEGQLTKNAREAIQRFNGEA